MKTPDVEPVTIVETNLNILNLLVSLGGLVLGALALGIGPAALLVFGLVLGFIARDVFGVRRSRPPS